MMWGVAPNAACILSFLKGKMLGAASDPAGTSCVYVRSTVPVLDKIGSDGITGLVDLANESSDSCASEP